jgi:hypothetical protein
MKHCPFSVGYEFRALLSSTFRLIESLFGAILQ